MACKAENIYSLACTEKMCQFLPQVPQALIGKRMGPARQPQGRLSGDGGGCDDSRSCQTLENWSQAELESTHLLQRAGGELRGSSRGQLSGFRRNVESRPPGRPPAAALPPIPAVWGQGRVWSQESQMWPVMPGRLPWETVHFIEQRSGYQGRQGRLAGARERGLCFRCTHRFVWP